MGTPVGHAGGHPALMWASGAPETRYAEERRGVRRLPGIRQWPVRPAVHRELGQQHRGHVGAPAMARYLQPSGALRPGDLLRQAGVRRLRPGAARRPAHARAVDGRRAHRDGCSRLGAGRADRRRRGRPDGHAVRRDLSGAHPRAGAGQHVRPDASVATTIRSGCRRRPRSSSSALGDRRGDGRRAPAQRPQRGRTTRVPALGGAVHAALGRRPLASTRIYRLGPPGSTFARCCRASRRPRWSSTGPGTRTTGRRWAGTSPTTSRARSTWSSRVRTGTRRSIDAEPLLDEIEEFLTGPVRRRQ